MRVTSLRSANYRGIARAFILFQRKSASSADEELLNKSHVPSKPALIFSMAENEDSVIESSLWIWISAISSRSRPPKLPIFNRLDNNVSRANAFHLVIFVHFAANILLHISSVAPGCRHGRRVQGFRFKVQSWGKEK